jgi:hypothetical protein
MYKTREIDELERIKVRARELTVNIDHRDEFKMD